MQYNYEHLNDNYEMSTPMMGGGRGDQNNICAGGKKPGAVYEMRTQDKS